MKTLYFQGCRLTYRIDGPIDGQGPPLIMIQGVGAQGISPNPQIEILSKHYTCLSFDNRGIGQSQPVGTKLTIDQMADDALALMDEVGWPTAHVIGHSLGGLTALQLALKAKHRVRSLTLLCSFANGADTTRLSAEILWIGLRIKLGTAFMKREAFLDLVLSPSERKGDHKELAARMAKVLGHDLADVPPITDQQVAAMARHDVTSRLHELSGIPTLVINGAQDPVARPASGRAIAAGITPSRYIQIPGTSHALPIIQASRCAALILEHLTCAEP